MKKLNFMIFGALMLTCLTTRALAETTIPWTKEGCESVKGKWITAHSPDESGCDANHCNGRNFCRSNVMMNWWTAFIWCKSIGRELTDPETACPNGISASYTCPNLKGNNGECWTNLIGSSGRNTLRVATSNGGLTGNNDGTNYGSRSGRFYALCK